MDNLTSFWLLVKYSFLGLFQGVTEPIPISSSGHIVILKKLFHIEAEGLSFEILVNFGSLIAVLVVYRQDIIRIINHFFHYLRTKDEAAKHDFHFVLYLILATIPTGLLGLLLKDYIENTLSTIMVVGVTLFLTGTALWMIRNLRGKKGDGDLTVKDALVVGLAQAVALIPGISRSGATIVAAMLIGMKRETALRFSFLLYIPVSLGVTIMSADDILTDPHVHILFIPYVLAFMAAIIGSYFALKWFINIMQHGKLKYFAFYCFAASLFILIFL